MSESAPPRPSSVWPSAVVPAALLALAAILAGAGLGVSAWAAVSEDDVFGGPVSGVWAPGVWTLAGWSAVLVALGALAVVGRRWQGALREALAATPGLDPDGSGDGLVQRNQLLESVLAGTPAALVVCDEEGRIMYANPHADELLAGGEALVGARFDDVLARHPPELRATADRPRIVVVEDEEPESYHVSTRGLRAQTHLYTLHMFRRVTDEVNRREIEVWKQVIRVFSHELGNSLAPIASLANSAQRMADRLDGGEKLRRVFETIRERTTHLEHFLERYAQFARLPRPERRQVAWGPLLKRLGDLIPFTLAGSAPGRAGTFDEAQIEQVLLNLLKNAHEAGSAPEEVVLEVRCDAREAVIEVRDRGRGMSAEALEQAHLPFYSTKRSGTGLGLALCRDIVLAHEGHMRLRPRQGGGLTVMVTLPQGRGAE
ncbi:sensor histidine kinase [Haliangium sp.]|uniref:sensor histidine kinase n=1 Tax=Haliangium sp. TaxID=2663208 RepID=UPI003D0A68AC